MSPLESEVDEELENTRLVSIEEFLRQDQEPTYCRTQPVSPDMLLFQTLYSFLYHYFNYVGGTFVNLRFVWNSGSLKFNSMKTIEP